MKSPDGVLADSAINTLHFTRTVTTWYAENARDLPWRRPEADAWGVLVSEVMLQQTPVVRVLPRYEEWLARWPTPADLASDSPGEAVRMWGRLGYPRRALRLHECARIITERHSGRVPSELVDLLALPGIGEYTARAVASFAYGQRHAVVDTNVRRLFVRVISGKAEMETVSPRRDLAMVEPFVPAGAAEAAEFAAAAMELGAVVCTAQHPRCSHCPLVEECAWKLAGKPPTLNPVKRTQAYAGTDRQVRGVLLAVARAASGPVLRTDLDATWPDATQRERALSSLLADGLLTQLPSGDFTLPGLT